MKKTGLMILMVMALCLAAGCGNQTKEQTEALKAYVEEGLPQAYLASDMYAIEIAEGENEYTVKLTLDMCADGSEYLDYTDEDYLMISEMEAAYLLISCIGEPPVPASFTLDMVFGEGVEATVEKPVGSGNGTLTFNGEKTEITL